jgi:hypothetical protein
MLVYYNDSGGFPLHSLCVKSHQYEDQKRCFICLSFPWQCGSAPSVKEAGCAARINVYTEPEQIRSPVPLEFRHRIRVSCSVSRVRPCYAIFNVNSHYCPVLPSRSTTMVNPLDNAIPSAITSSLFLPTLLLVAIGLVLPYRCYSRRYTLSNTTLPPGPKGFPWVGPIGQLHRHEEWKAFRAWNVEYSTFLPSNLTVHQ